MNSRRPPELTPAEFTVMKVLWDVGSASVSQVRERLESDLAYTTVMTLLARLAKKKAVTVDKSQQPFVYKPAFGRGSVRSARLRKFVDTVFDGRASSLVMQLVESEELSEDDVERIRALLDDRGAEHVANGPLWEDE